MKTLLVGLIILLVVVITFTVYFNTGRVDYGESDYASFFVFLIAVATLGAGIFVVAVIISYKTKLRGAIYPLEKFTKLDLTSHSDVYSHSHTTKYRYKSSKK